ncbi:adenosylcobinamide-GDP ribazoletransferase [Desulfovibrio inopinatus]|uniref:adenosylcobinamide-GDP ribazoletransferase n=1 Tax=Desulfovibrio inopinatus TaxID=102109 RepID=UPI0003F9516B|nr:adenosylcobinamide-GDP ribazoletransferase [Desulfovibrio inopinatus]
MMAFLRRLRIALSFLTRLAPAKSVSNSEFAASLETFPAVGLVLGLIICAPFACGLLAHHPHVAGWLAVGGSIVLTRGLHLDGLADIADGWGSGAVGERFWEIVKDSRIGAFGVIALVFFLMGQAIIFGTLFQDGHFGAIAYAFVLGRAAAVWLSIWGKAITRPGLGNLFATGATWRTGWLVLIQTLLFGLVLTPLPGLILSFLLTGICLGLLFRLARRQSGLNGDFLGSAVILCETATGLACLIVA